MEQTKSSSTLLISKILLIGYLVIGLVPRFRSVDPIGFHWFYLSLLDLVGLFFIFRTPAFLEHIYLGKLAKWFFGNYLLFIIVAASSIAVALSFSEGVKDLGRIVITFVGLFNVYVFLNKYPHEMLNWIVKISHFTIVAVALQVIAIFAEDFSAPRSGAMLKATNLVTYGNQNATSATLVMQLPFVLYGIVRHIGRWRVFSYIAFALGVMAIFFIGSRTAALSGIGIISLFLGFTLLRCFTHNRDYLKPLSRGVLLPTILLLLVSFLFVTNVNRYEPSRANTFSELVLGYVEKTTLNDNPKAERAVVSDNVRPYYYKAAIDYALNNPVLGVGLGGWKFGNKDEYFLSLNKTNYLYPIRTHNDFLQMLSETGFLGGLLYLTLFVILAIIVLVRLIKNFKSDDGWVYLILLFCLVTYGIDALINFPMERTPIQGHFIVFSALIMAFYSKFSVNNEVDSGANQLKKPQLVKYVSYSLFVLSIINAFIAYLQYDMHLSHNNFMSDTTKKNLLVDDYTISYGRVKRELSGFFNTSVIGRPNAHLMGMYAMNEKKYDIALKHLIESEKQAPNHYESTMLKAIIYNQFKVNRDSAIYHAKIGFEKYPSDRNSFLVLLQSYEKLRDTTKAIDVIEKRVSYKPDDLNARKMLIERLLIYVKDDKRSLEAVNDALKYFPKNQFFKEQKERLTTNVFGATVNKKSALALEYMNTGEYLKSQKEYLDILEIVPENYSVLLNLGIVSVKLKQYNKAISYLTKVIDSKKFKDGRAEYSRGLAYERLKDYRKAGADWRISKARGFGLAQKLTAKQLKY